MKKCHMKINITLQEAVKLTKNLTCAVSDFITSFAALDLADSSAASDIAS